jgi:uncharacterized protein YcnI
VTIVDGSAIPSGGSAVIYFRLPHGCDGAPVDALEVQLPDGVVGAKPQAIAGWTITTEMVPADYELYGTTYTERVGTIRWEGGPLADSEYLDFGVSATFQLEPGEYAIPAVQYCGDESVAWIEIPAEGQDHDELEAPAPTITVVEADAEGGHGHGDPGAEEPSAEVEALTAEIEALTAELEAANQRIDALETQPVADTTTMPMLLTVVALVAGLAGLGLGFAALRRKA